MRGFGGFFSDTSLFHCALQVKVLLRAAGSWRGDILGFLELLSIFFIPLFPFTSFWSYYYEMKSLKKIANIPGHL